MYVCMVLYTTKCHMSEIRSRGTECNVLSKGTARTDARMSEWARFQRYGAMIEAVPSRCHHFLPFDTRIILYIGYRVWIKNEWTNFKYTTNWPRTTPKWRCPPWYRMAASDRRPCDGQQNLGQMFSSNAFDTPFKLLSLTNRQKELGKKCSVHTSFSRKVFKHYIMCLSSMLGGSEPGCEEHTQWKRVNNTRSHKK